MHAHVLGQERREAQRGHVTPQALVLVTDGQQDPVGQLQTDTVTAEEPATG